MKSKVYLVALKSKCDICLFGFLIRKIIIQVPKLVIHKRILWLVQCFAFAVVIHISWNKIRYFFPFENKKRSWIITETKQLSYSYTDQKVVYYINLSHCPDKRRHSVSRRFPLHGRRKQKLQTTGTLGQTKRTLVGTGWRPHPLIINNCAVTLHLVGALLNCRMYIVM